MKARSRTPFIVTVALLAGCGDATGPEQSIEGEWVLSTVDDQALPHQISWGTQSQVWLTAGSRVFGADGSCTNQSTSETYTASPTGGWSVSTNTTDSVCTWRRSSENRFSVVSTGGFTFEAMRDGAALLLTAPSGTEYRYQRGGAG